MSENFIFQVWIFGTPLLVCLFILLAVAASERRGSEAKPEWISAQISAIRDDEVRRDLAELIRQRTSSIPLTIGEFGIYLLGASIGCRPQRSKSPTGRHCLIFPVGPLTIPTCASHRRSTALPRVWRQTCSYGWAWDISAVYRRRGERRVLSNADVRRSHFIDVGSSFRLENINEPWQKWTLRPEGAFEHPPGLAALAARPFF